MRKDLNKQLCERERLGHDRKFHEVRHARKVKDADAEEVIGGREGMKRRHIIGGHGETKMFNENLNPLWGVIRKNANRPWNKVYAEFCSVFDKRSVINQHILDHLNDFVAINTYEQDGEIYIKSRWGRDDTLKGGWQEYYVHPRTGLLLKNPHYRSWKQERRERDAKRAAEAAKVHRVIDDKNELFCIEGTWFLAEMKPTPTEYTQKHVPFGYSLLNKPHQTRIEKEYPKVFDVIKEETVCYPRDKRYAASKKTASHKELKKYGIVK